MTLGEDEKRWKYFNFKICYTYKTYYLKAKPRNNTISGGKKKRRNTCTAKGSPNLEDFILFFILSPQHFSLPNLFFSRLSYARSEILPMLAPQTLQNLLSTPLPTVLSCVTAQPCDFSSSIIHLAHQLHCKLLEGRNQMLPTCVSHFPVASSMISPSLLSYENHLFLLPTFIYYYNFFHALSLKM